MTDLPPTTDRIPPWPDGTAHTRIRFCSDRPADWRVVAELPVSLNRRAVALPLTVAEVPEFELLAGPVAEVEDPALVLRLRDWAGGVTAQVITFQGTTLVWGAGRAAVLAAADRLPALEAVLCELAYYERELTDIEKQLGEAWPDLEADAGPAFEFDERSARQRDRLAKRFAQLLGLRARLTRVLPHLLTPHVFPPTLASQVSERLRERFRMNHRVEMIQEQLEVFERVYDTVGQRASDYKANRKNHLLEMTIIVFLAVQTFLTFFEIVTSTKIAPTTTTSTAK